MLASSRQPLVLLLATAFASSCFAQKSKPADGSNIQSAAAARPFVGCYELRFGRWWPIGFFGGDDEFVTPPRRVNLLSEHGTEGFEQFGFLIRAMSLRQGEKPGRGGFSYWQVESSTKIDLIWNDGFTGVTLSLAKHRDAFRGRAHAHFDTLTLPRFQRVTAHRIPCDATTPGK